MKYLFNNWMKNKVIADSGNQDSSIPTKENLTALKEEIERLKTQISKLHLTDETKWGSSVIQVRFRNENVSRKYKKNIEKFLRGILDEDEDFFLDCTPDNTAEAFVKETNQSFCIDKLHNKTHDNSSLPFYSMSFDEVLQYEDSKPGTTEKMEVEKAQTVTCFNCLGDHHLKKCPEKYDRSRIAMNRKEYQSLNAGRYHDDDSQNNAMQPGLISDGLKEALGLRPNQMPLYIYHMRVLGYPPGWMKEAEFETSGLLLYDLSGKAVRDEHSISSGTKYDGTKFVNYPGFNTPVPNGMTDEWTPLQMPPIQSHQQLNEALKSPTTINSSVLYKRKKMPDVFNGEQKKVKNGLEGPSTFSNWKPNYESTPKRTRCSSHPVDHNTNDTQNMSLSMSLGTPIMAQGNPYNKLPDCDKFAQGITEHMPFENLPDSVGTFEKMRGVLNELHKKRDTS